MKTYVLLISIFLFTSNVFTQTVETITTSFNASGGVAIDDSGIVYVADFGQFLNQGNGTKVYKVYDDGTVTEFASGLLGASGNEFDSKGNLYQSNIAGNRLSKITSEGEVMTFATTGIFGPVGVAVADGDTIYVANCGGNSIAKVSPDGTSSVWLTSDSLQCPNGLTIDDEGNLYTCNFGNGNIIKITPAKEVSVLATLPGGRCGHLTYFEGVLYVVARCAHKIYQVTLNGDTTLIAGTGGRGNDDGPGTEATFNHPNGIEAKREGNNIVLYINDAVSLSGNCTTAPLNPVVIRKITISPVNIDEDKNSPSGYNLYQNYPNPFNPHTKLRFSIPKSGNVKVKIIDMLGREIETIVNEYKNAGEHEVIFDAAGLSSGVYAYQLYVGGFLITKSMTLLK